MAQRIPAVSNSWSPKNASVHAAKGPDAPQLKWGDTQRKDLIWFAKLKNVLPNSVTFVKCSLNVMLEVDVKILLNPLRR